ncbi:MAG TPA: metallopeptidase TldD-related protein [Terriglobales bacterium]|jgi:predicted Zn-dependent protease|nr:metallopeptidase TldD-related protein [Terriglobales bacterium]
MKIFRTFLEFVPRPGMLAAILIVASSAHAQDDVPMQAMKDELKRSVSQLQLQKMDKPYFIAYRMDEMNNNTVSATLGSLTQQAPSRIRLVGVEIRVGNYDLDNSNYVSIRDLGGGMSGMFSGIRQAPLDDNYRQIRRSFWLATDAQYKKALEDLSAKRAAFAMRQHGNDVPDFSKETPATKFAPPENTGPGQDLKALARDISAVFKSTPEINNSSVELEFHNFYTRYVNSEGSGFTRARALFKFQITAQAQSQDGQPISDSIEFYGRERADLPDTAALVARARAMADHILKLRSAATLESYNGPVLFEGTAAGEAFTQQFATGLLVVRTPSSDDARFEAFFNQMMSRLGGTSLVDKIGGRVLPEFISVSDHPQSSDYKGVKLLGANQIDDDAVPTRETTLVDHGVLKTLLSTRVPVRNVRQSTGSRRGWGAAPSNLFVTSDKSMTDAELRKELLRRAKERGLDYGIVVRRIGGGAAASFMKMAAAMGQQDSQGTTSIGEIYKLYPDGHEELLRGMEVSEFPSSTFKDIVAVGDTPVVFTDEFIPRVGALFSMGISAGSDMPIVSCIAPSMLFEELSLNKAQGPFPNPPISPSPLAKQ